MGKAVLNEKYSAYSEYKDSGLAWLGEVPNHWIVSKFGYVKTVLTDYTANGSFADLKKNVVYRDEPSHARLVRLTDLRVNLENQNGVWIDKDAYNYLGKSALFGGEFLLANVGAYAGLFYQMPEGKGNASLAPNMFMAKFDGNKILREFMAYVGQSQSANEQLRLNATASSAQPKLNKDDFKSVIFTYPPIDEQQKIANFLDHETAKIDTLIEKQQQLIALLKEKRQAVISHAVTKGLNPDAPMRDSGVEWLGEVPEHWEVISIKHLSSVKRGASPRPIDDQKYFDDSGDYAWVRIADVSKAGMYLTSTTQRLSELGSSLSVKLEADELFVSIAGTVGKPCLTISKACIHDGFVYFPDLKINNKFLYYIFEAGEAYLGLGKMGTQLNLNTDSVGGIKIGLPPLNEIGAIINIIEKSNIKYDDLINKANKSISLMQERRTALISAAVTGKIDVRKWAENGEGQ